jgi:hypothetical protein
MRILDERQTGMFSYRAGICNQRWLKGRKSRFSGSEAALSVRAGEKQTRIRLLDRITSLAAT